jgi:hypothetical protein
MLSNDIKNLSDAYYSVPTHPGKWEKPGKFIPLAPGRVMPLKIEKTVKNREEPLKFVYQKSLDNFLDVWEHCNKHLISF